MTAAKRGTNKLNEGKLSKEGKTKKRIGAEIITFDIGKIKVWETRLPVFGAAISLTPFPFPSVYFLADMAYSFSAGLEGNIMCIRGVPKLAKVIMFCLKL